VTLIGTVLILEVSEAELLFTLGGLYPFLFCIVVPSDAALGKEVDQDRGETDGAGD